MEVGQPVFADLITARRTVALGALVLALGAAACGDDSSSGSGGGAGGSKEAKLAFVYPTTTTHFAQEMALGAKAAFCPPAHDADLRAGEAAGPEGTRRREPRRQAHGGGARRGQRAEAG